MYLATEQRIPEGLLAASVLLDEKLHQGFECEKAGLHQGFEGANSTALLGVAAWGSGGIVLGETYNDFFGARYLSSSMGRYLTPDFMDDEYGPVSIPYYNPQNPQSLNLYSYSFNNPLTNTDEDGHAVTICNPDGKTGCHTIWDDQAYAKAQQQDKSVNAPTLNDLQNSGKTTNITDSNGNVVGTAKWTPENPGIEGPANVAAFGQIGNQGMGAIKAFAIGSVVGGTIGGVGLATGVIGGGAGLTTLGDLSSGLTEHAAARLAARGITPAEARAAIQAAEKAGDVVTKIGRYGTPQKIFTANGIRVVVEQAGANAGKIITAFFK